MTTTSTASQPGATGTASPRRYHERGTYLVQADPRGDWHGYVGCVYRRSFDGEAAALRWLDNPDTPVGGA